MRNVSLLISGKKPRVGLSFLKTSARVKLGFFFVFAVFLLLLSACSSMEQNQQTSPSVYRVVKAEYFEGDALIRSEPLGSAGGKDELSQMLSAVSHEPQDPETTKVLPSGVEIIHYEMDGAELKLEMSSKYLWLKGFQKTLTDYCLTLSFCSLEGVDTVSIYVNSEPSSAGLSTEDVLLFDTETNPYERHLRLFFASSEGRYLTSEYRSLSAKGDVPLARVVVQELLHGPYDDTLVGAIPIGTQLLSVNLEGRVCVVNLSAEFLSGMPTDAVDTRLSIYSLVNSLTLLSGVDSVRILVDGETLANCGSFVITDPLSNNEFAVGPAKSARGEVDVNIYVRGADRKLVAVPRIISLEAFSTVGEGVVHEMIAGEPEPGFDPLFPEGSEINSMKVSDGLCVLDFPASFFSRFSSHESLDTALSALSMALKDIEGISGVLILSDGEAAKYQEDSL